MKGVGRPMGEVELGYVTIVEQSAFGGGERSLFSLPNLERNFSPLGSTLSRLVLSARECH